LGRPNGFSWSRLAPNPGHDPEPNLVRIRDRNSSQIPTRIWSKIWTSNQRQTRYIGPTSIDEQHRRAFLDEEKVGGRGRGPIGLAAGGGEAERPLRGRGAGGEETNGEPQTGNFSEERNARRAAPRGRWGWVFKSCRSRSALSIRCDETS
jgi:hypothetical protein